MNFPYVNVKFVGNDGNYYMERITKVKFIWKWKDGGKKCTRTRTQTQTHGHRHTGGERRRAYALTKWRKKDNAREVRVFQKKRSSSSKGEHRFLKKNAEEPRRKRSTMSGVTLYHLRQVKYWHNFSSIILNAAKKDTRPVCSHTLTLTQRGRSRIDG